MKKDVILNEESGQGTMEYALIMAILSIIGIVAWSEIGEIVVNMLTGVANDVANVVNSL